MCAAKTTFPKLRVIARVNLLETKKAVTQISGWNSQDIVICVAEVTQNLIAQNALAVGAASVIATLMKARDTKCSRKCDDRVKLQFQRG